MPLIECPHMSGEDVCSICLELHGLKERLRYYSQRVSLMRKYQREWEQSHGESAHKLKSKLETVVDAMTSTNMDLFPNPVLSRDAQI